MKEKEMKRFKKLTALLVALAMMVALMPSAFAAGSITIQTKDSDGNTVTDTTHTYAIYQVFTGTYSDNGTLTDVKWGKNAASASGYTPGTAVSHKILAEIEKLSSDSGETAAAISEYVDFVYYVNKN